MRLILPFLIPLLAADAAIQNVTVTEFSATQAIIKYQGPDQSPCTVEISENPTFIPVVNDVDPAKFASASSDLRAGSINAGGERFFVAGKRAAEIGLDGVRYSRALQADTIHYYRITCAGPGNLTTGTFKTSNIPFGNTYVEAEPGDRNRPGTLAQPHISLSNRNERVIDAQTGLLLKRLSAASDTFVPIDGAPFTVARGSDWQDLSNLAASDGSVATISASTAPLFLGIKTNTAGQAPYTEYINSFEAAYVGRPKGAWGYYQAHIVASVNQGGTAPVNPDDAKIVACLTVDGINCFDDSNNFEAALTTNAADISFGTKTTGDLWQKPGHVSPNWTLEGTRTGSSMCDGTPLVNMVTGDFYGLSWVAGSAIQINGIDYVVSSVVNTTKIVLNSNCPSTFVGTGAFDADNRIFRTATDMFTPANNGQVLYVAGAGGGGGAFASQIDQVVDARTVITHDFPPVRGQQTQFGYPVGHAASNFGVLVRKKTNSADTISIDYGYVNYELDLFGSFTVGGVKLCSDFTVAGPNGNQGYNCQLPNGNLYWIDAESGEAHLWGNLNTEPNKGCGSDQQLFSALNPDQYWCAGYGPLYSTTYYGNHSEPTTLNANGGIRLFQSLNNCNTNPPNTAPYTNQQPCLVSQLITPGTDLPSLAEAFTANSSYSPQFEKAKFGSYVKFKDIDENGNLILAYSRGANFVIAWLVVFNPNATSNVEGGSIAGAVGNLGCVGGGHPGCVVAAAPGWARPGCRWCTYKEGSSPFPGWINSYTYGWTNSSPGSGPYYVQVIDGSANGTGNVIDNGSSLQNCPVNVFGATGLNCTTVTVASEPLSPPHGGLETGLPGEIGNAMEGDVFAMEVAFASAQAEQARLIKKTPGAVPGTWVYTLLRDINHHSPDAHRYAVTGPNPALYTVCGANPDPSAYGTTYTWFWDFVDDPHAMNATGKTIPPDSLSWNDHQFWSHGNWVVLEQQTHEPRCYNGTCYATRVWGNRPFYDVITQQAYTAVISASPKWGKGGGIADESNIQSHATAGGPAASPDRFPYFFDGRPYRGGYVSGSGGGTGSNPADRVSGQLYHFPRSAMTNLELPFRKIYPTAAFTGQTPLVDISSPAQGDVIGADSADSFKYCVVQIAGECRAGSVAGDVYVNAPHLDYPFCYQAAQNLNLSDQYDICIGGSPAIRDAIVQVGMNESDLDGHSLRILTKFARPRTLSVFHTPDVLPNGKWMIFEAQLPGDASANKAIMLGKVPPPAEKDKIDRTTFVPITLRIPAHSNSTAFVRFGYAENGDPGSYFCTSRAESCISNRQTEQLTDVANPFYFEQTERTKYQPVDCGNGCQLTVSGLPQHVLYYQVVYTDAAGGVTQTPMLATVVP